MVNQGHRERASNVEGWGVGASVTTVAFAADFFATCS